MAVLLKRRARPNLVQTIEGNPAFSSMAAVRQHRPWLQFGDRHRGGAAARRLRGDRGRLRGRISARRSSSTSVPQRRSGACRRRRGGDRAGAEDAGRRGEGRLGTENLDALGKGLCQSRPPCGEPARLRPESGGRDQRLRQRYGGRARLVRPCLRRTASGEGDPPSLGGAASGKRIWRARGGARQKTARTCWPSSVCLSSDAMGLKEEDRGSRRGSIARRGFRSPPSRRELSGSR